MQFICRKRVIKSPYIKQKIIKMKKYNKISNTKLNSDILEVEKGCNIATDIIKAINDLDENKSLEEYTYLKECIENNSHFEELHKNIVNIEKYKVYNNIDEDILNFRKKINKTKVNESKSRSLKRIIYSATSVAASIIFLSLYVYLTPSNGYQEPQLKGAVEPVVPYMILSNGVEVEIDNVGMSIVGNSDKFNENKLSEYVNEPVGDNDTKVKENARKFNTIVVPSKCTYTFVLEDGSEVSLNANSTLKFPVKFDDISRSVELTGEAYFNVVKGDIPFIVKNSRFKIKVFGTKFNVRSSFNDVLSEAVLIDGSIGITVNGTDSEVMLIPNEMFRYNEKSNTSVVTEVNAANYVNWMTGTFKYEKASIIDIIGDIERWYGVQIVGEIENQAMSMTMSKSVDLDDLLSIIQSVINVKFIKEGGDKYNVINPI